MKLTTETIENFLDETASEIRYARNLDDLLAGLAAFVDACKDSSDYLDVENEMRVRGIDMTSLPTFGGYEPTDTAGIWSWSDSHMIVGSCISDMRIVSR